MTASSRERVLRARPTLGRREAAALRRDRAALDAVRRGDLDRRPVRLPAGSVSYTCAGHMRDQSWPSSRRHQGLRCGCGSAGRRGCDCPRGRPTRACRRSARRPPQGTSRRATWSRARAPRLARSDGRRPGAGPSSPSRGPRAPPTPEARAEGLAHVPHLAQVAPDERGSRSVAVVAAELTAPPRERPPGRLGSQPARLDRVVDPFSAGTLTSPAPSPQRSSPGAWRRRGSETKPPSGIVFAPHSMRSPPSRIGRIRGWVFSSWSRSWTESRGVAVVEPDDHPDRRPCPRPSDRRTSRRTRGSVAADAQRPAHRVDHLSERPRRPSRPP